MSEDDKYLSISREFANLDQYRKLLIGKTIKAVHFTTDTDEGLVITCEDGSVLYFGFSGSEGTIIVAEE